MILTSPQFCLWGNDHLDVVLDVGDLAAGLRHIPGPVERWEVVKRLADRLLPNLPALMETPVCDTMSYSRVEALKDGLLARLDQFVRGRRDVKGMTERDREWLSDAKATTHLLLYLIAP